MKSRSTLKRFAITFVLAAVLLLSASCKAKSPYQTRSTAQLTNPDEIKVYMKAEVIAENTIKVSIENKSEKTFIYGNAYTLEFLSGDTWYEVPFKEEGGPVFTMEGKLLGPAEEFAKPNEDGLTISDTASDDVRLEGFAVLSKGHYRIVKNFSLLNDEDGSVVKTCCLAAEFDL